MTSPPSIDEPGSAQAETITAAAILHDGKVYSVPSPGRHHNVCRVMMALGMDASTMRVQGFLTNVGRFVGREEAAIIAEAAGQLVRKTSPADLLFSEDVW